MGSSNKTKVVAECKGCVKARGDGTCLAFAEPGWFWSRYGSCPGRMEDPKEWERVQEECRRYAGAKAAEK